MGSIKEKKTLEDKRQKSGRKIATGELVQIALMSAVFCVLAPIAMPVPFSPVPITFGTFVLYVTAAVFGYRKGCISVAVYLLIGLAGLPVFSGFTAGFTKLLGPGGGYMIGYLPAAWLIGRMAEARVRKEHAGEKQARHALRMFGIFICGAFLCYTFGTVWFLTLMEGTYTLGQALLVCVVPFLPFEAIKIVLAAVLILPMRRLLTRAGVL